MKKFLGFINFIVSCQRCFGNGTIETNDGGTKECHICKGKGYIK